MSESETGRVLIVAGSDSGGGAGIQADIKTCAAFGVFSTTAVTAITAQNTVGVQRVEALAADLVVDQMRSVLSDIGADVIKIGMLANKDIIEAVADCIATDAEDTTVVLDPVLVSTSGDALLDEGAVETLKEKLLPLADVITPNTVEAGVLTGIEIDDSEAMIKAGDTLREMGAYAAMMKGGHLAGNTIVDILVADEGNQIMTAPRIKSKHTHGTGCTLASAIAALMAQGAPLEVAVMEAREYVFGAIRAAPGLGKGNGPLNHGFIFQGAEVERGDKANPFAVLKDLQ